MPGPSHVGLAADLVEGFSGVMAEGEPASPHPEDCTRGLACATSSHQDNGARGVRVILNDGLLGGGHSEGEIHFYFTHVLHHTGTAVGTD